MRTTSNNKCKLLSTITLFFSSLNILTIAFIFSSTRYFLINAWFSKSIRPIITSLCVPCTAMWKHLVSSLWMNMVDFIFRLLHIRIHFILSVLTPLGFPYTCFANYAHLSIDCENTYGECTCFLLTLPIILMIVQIFLITEWILLLIQLIHMTYHM